MIATMKYECPKTIASNLNNAMAKCEIIILIFYERTQKGNWFN